MTTKAQVNYPHGGRTCPNCKEPALPKGRTVCCQNCYAIVVTEGMEIIGALIGGQAEYYPKSKYAKIKEFVEGLDAVELTYLDEIIKEKKRG